MILFLVGLLALFYPPKGKEAKGREMRKSQTKLWRQESNVGVGYYQLAPTKMKKFFFSFPFGFVRSQGGKRGGDA